MNKERPFKDWKFDRYSADSPDGEYVLWIANGFFSFEDWDGGSNSERKNLLFGLGVIDKYKVWRTLKKEARIRAQEKVKGIINKPLFHE